MKTISELNQKVWYRFLKVIFLLTIIVSASVSFLVFCPRSPSQYISKEKLLKDLEVITAEYKVGNLKDLKFNTFTGHMTGNYSFDFQGYLYGYNVEKFHDKASIERLGKYIKILSHDGYKQYSNYENGKMINDKYFTNIPQREVKNKYREMLIEYSVIIIAIWLLIFEIIRRTFFYIVLGSLFPPK